VLILSAPHDKLAVGCVLRSSHISIADDAVAKTASLR